MEKNIQQLLFDRLLSSCVSVTSTRTIGMLTYLHQVPQNPFLDM